MLMLNINDILYKYILEHHGSISDFADYSGIPLIELNAILLKDNISLDIRSGLILCKKLNINIEKLIFSGEISELCPDYAIEENRENDITEVIENNQNENDKDSIYETELRDRYMRLSEIEKKEVLEFVNKISGRHETNETP